MKLFVLMLGAWVLLFSSFAFAGAYTGSAKINIMSSMVEGDPAYGTYFIIRGEWTQNDIKCPSAATDTWVVKDNKDSMDVVKSMYSMALAAYTSGKKIEMYQDGCVNGRPKGISMYTPNR